MLGAVLEVVGARFLIHVAEPVVHRTRASSDSTFFKVATHPVLLMASLMSVLLHFGSERPCVPRHQHDAET